MTETRERDAGRPTVLIFRKRLLHWSETFIATQGGALRRYRPIFAGYRKIEAGIGYLDGRDCVILEDYVHSKNLAKAALKSIGYVAPRWRRALVAYQPVVMHVHFGVNALDAIPIARSLGIPMVVTYHGMDIAIERQGRRVHRQRARVFGAAARIIAVSEFIAERLREAGCPEHKLVVHRIGVDMERFAPGPPRQRVQTEILFVGRIVPKKGLIHLIRAMPMVQSAVPAAQLIVAGDGPLRAQLEDEAARLGARCRFLGRQTPDQVRGLMRTAAVFCAPSVVAANGNAEGLPMTVIEAQASGLGVVAFPSGGLAEGIVEGVTGSIAQPGDEQGLAQRLVALLGDPAQRERVSEAAREHVVANFNLARQAEALERIYDEARSR